jgi:SAM-dependent methyltransferase
MDSLQLSRRKIFFAHKPFSKNHKGLEVGPYTRATVYPNEAEMYYADYYTTEELKEQAKGLNLPTETILDVHYVLKTEELHVKLGNDKFDFIIANHVLEHVVDPFRWLKNLEPALKPNGRFLITLPDKRFSFDKFRSDTTLTHFIEDFLMGGERSINEHALEAGLYYDNGYVKKENDAADRLNLKAVHRCRQEIHPGMHVHVFQAETFLNNVLLPFLAIGFLNLRLETFELNINLGEFSFSLVKTESPQPFNVRPDIFFSTASDTLPVRGYKICRVG